MASNKTVFELIKDREPFESPKDLNKEEAAFVRRGLSAGISARTIAQTIFRARAMQKK